MASRITLYDHFGNYLTEVNATFNREYKQNEFGTGTFTLSTSDEKCREDYLQFGNFVLVEHDKLPAWGGMIDTPRIWESGSVTSSVYSAEYILTCMLTIKVLNVQGTYGSIFRQLIEQMSNNDIAEIIRIGDIYGGGKAIKRKYNYETLYDAIKRLCKDSGNDFEIQPTLDDNGRLYFTANWYQKMGMLKPYKLYENTNVALSNVPLREQGRIGNKLRIYGPGATFQTRPFAWRDDQISIGKYGQRYLAQLGQGDDLNADADALITELSTPRKTFNITAIDTGDTYSQLRIGDQYPVNFYSVGFNGSGFGTSETVRLLQMSFDEANNKLVLVMDQVKNGQ